MKKTLLTVGLVAAASPLMAATNISELITQVEGNWTAALAVGLTIMGILLGIRVVKKAIR